MNVRVRKVLARPAVALAFLAFCFFGVSLHAEDLLYGSTNSGILFTVNLATGTGTPVGQLAPCPQLEGNSTGTIPVTEIEYDPASGRSFAQAADGAFCGSTFALPSGTTLSSVLDSGSFNGIEVVGGTWYATAITSPGGPSTLLTFNPATGSSTPIGATGVGPISGLAWDGSTMYGIGGGSGPANLYTINLATGVATLVGNTGIQAGSLEFGPDGKLYAGGSGNTAPPPSSSGVRGQVSTVSSVGNIYTINTSTGAATLLGPTGFAESITGLMLAPAVSVPTLDPRALLALAAILAILGAFVIRR